ncbi:sugar transporter [Lysobacteraceae bacterium NML08-0793]|nr:sugar transporter [Xanthomonadaceae bacterium NML08-0793]
MKNILRLAPVALIFVLTACGNKGPLTLPQKPLPVEAPAEAPPAPTPAPDADTTGGDGSR